MPLAIWRLFWLTAWLRGRRSILQNCMLTMRRHDLNRHAAACTQPSCSCMQTAAEARLCPLPDLSSQLSLPSTQQQRQQQPDAAAAPPSMPRLAGQLLPLRKMPPAFVLILAPLAKFWGDGHTLPLAQGVAANSADLQACEQMATAVLAAKRGAGAWWESTGTD